MVQSNCDALFVFMKGEVSMTKRKDDKGRVLEKGESQRPDGTYMYRWTDLSKKRQTIYATTLNKLREKELEIAKAEKISGVNWTNNKMTVRELLELYKELKVVKVTTTKKYQYFNTILEKIHILDVPIKNIHTSDAKRYMMALRNLGYAYGTIQNVKAFLSPAFQMAVEDDFLVKNPFLFRLCNIIDDDRKERTSISKEVEKKYLDFVKNHGWFKHCYADIIILLHTGLRVSELYGLTFKDIDLKNNRIYVNKQLHKIDGRYIVMSPKSKAGTRTLAMTEEVRKAFMSKYIEPRPQIERIIDGHSGFIFINKEGNPKTRQNLKASMITIRDKANELGIKDFANITPHVLRHTFCSRMIESGIDVKSLQIIMGHSDIGTTLNVYTHKDPEDVAKTMENLLLGKVANP